MDETIFIYDETKAPIVAYRHEFGGKGKLIASHPVYGALDGVPTRDLVLADWDQLPIPLRRAVLAQPFYIATPAAANLELPKDSDDEVDDEAPATVTPAPKGKRGKE